MKCINKYFTEEILGYNVWSSGPYKLSETLENQLADKNACRWLACLNPHSYVVAINDAAFHKALQGADWLLPDGVGVVLASRLQRGQIHGRITGYDVFHSVNKLLQLREGCVFFLGASEDTLARICEHMKRDYPAVKVVGALSPPYRAEFSDEENASMVAAVNASGADVLWVAMTAPKQEKWLQENAALLDVKLAGAIGAVFDFYAGKVQRSSPIFQQLGLEWLPRLLREPRRLWRRTLVSAPIFLWHALKATVRSLYLRKSIRSSSEKSHKSKKS